MSVNPTVMPSRIAVRSTAPSSRRLRRSLGLLAALLVAAPGALAAQQPGHSHDTDALPTVPSAAARAAMPNSGGAPDTLSTSTAAGTLRAVFAAAERNDLAALDGFYAGDSLTVVEGTGINRGWTAYRDHHLGPELKEMKNFRYRPFDLEARERGDLAWVLFRYALSGELGGKTIDNVGRGTAILERRDGRWIVRHTQTTSRARRPSDPPAAR